MTARTLLLWFPDWPIQVVLTASGLTQDVPLALVNRGEIFACSAAARLEGVKRGLPVREAQARCTALLVQSYDPALDHRAFEPLVSRIEQLVPGVQIVRPGTCLLRAKGPSRFYGGERAVIAVLLEAMAELGAPMMRIGLADGTFAAEHAAKHTPADHPVAGDPFLIIESGHSPEFLAAQPVELLGRPELATLLRRLGVRTLGDFAAIEADKVRDRFGIDGVRAQLLAAGRDAGEITPRTPPPDHAMTVEFEPPLDRVDQIAFAFRTAAEGFVEKLAAAALVATSITVTVTTEAMETKARTWLHPRWFTASDVLDRVRWQVQGAGAVDSGFSSPIIRVRADAASVDAADNHEQGLWGTGRDERVHHGLSRVQSMVGHDGVLTARVSGGRMLNDRCVLVPWGDLPPGGEVAVVRAKALPWPGSLPGPAPATVFPEWRSVTVTANDGTAVDVTERGLPSAEPAAFTTPAGARRGVDGWAGPWPVTERWWDADGRRLNRFQLVDDKGAAWLLVLKDHRWWAEASYD